MCRVEMILRVHQSICLCSASSTLLFVGLKLFGPHIPRTVPAGSRPPIFAKLPWRWYSNRWGPWTFAPGSRGDHVERNHLNTWEKQKKKTKRVWFRNHEMSVSDMKSSNFRVSKISPEKKDSKFTLDGRSQLDGCL